MKKTFANIRTLAAVLMASAALVACNKEHNATAEQTPQVYTLTIQAGMNDGTQTKALELEGTKLVAKWANDETVDVRFGATLLGTLTVSNVSADGKTCTLSGTLTGAIYKHDVLRLYYNHFTGTVNESQTGSLTSAAENDYALASVTVKSVDGSDITLESDPSFVTQVAVLKITMKDGSDNKLNATKLEISGDNISTITFSPTAATYTENGDGVLYFAMPSAETLASANSTDTDVLATMAVTFTATVGADTYTVTKTGYAFAAGKYYATTLTMAEAAAYTLLSAATTSDYGKVVCADGHLHDAKTAVPAGCTAVGILGKVTETGHGLILALQDATSQNWNTINGWTSVTTYAGTTLKVLPDDAARGANLTSYTALGTTAVSNWAVAQKSDYEAIFKNLGSTQGDSDGTTCDGNANAYITNGVDGTEISGSYWSATVKSESAWYFDTYWAGSNVSNPFFVRPVLGFGGDAAPAGPTAYTLAESTVGMIVGTDGKAYAAADKDNLPLGVTAVAMVAYKSATAGESLAIQLNDSPENMIWADAKTNAEGLTAVSGGTWRLPSKDDWQNMFVGCAVSGDATVPDANNEMDPIAGFKAKIAATGITWKSSNYWSSTESSSPLAWFVAVKLDDSDAYATFGQNLRTSSNPYVLGCLVF